MVSPAQGIKVQVRKTQGGSTTKLANPAGTTPAWLKISWSGSTFTAYTSADGVSWTLIPGSSVSLSLGTSVLAGLAVTSHKSGALGTVMMNGVQWADEVKAELLAAGQHVEGKAARRQLRLAVAGCASMVHIRRIRTPGKGRCEQGRNRRWDD